jgi:hypothetical protein
MKNTELENYLTKLEKALGPIAVSEKAEIITEIKSHVLDSLDTNSLKSTKDILSSLGEPEQVANKYLLERGLEPQKLPKHSILNPILKWLTIGFLGTITLIVLSFFLVLWKFTPIVKVDEKNGHVQILGGLIDINDSDEKLNNAKELSGDIKITEQNKNDIFFDFGNALVDFENNEVSNAIRYECKLDHEGKINVTENNKIYFDFKNTDGVKCNIYVPEKLNFKVNATNGKFTFDEMENSLNADIANGLVSFYPKSTAQYFYEMSVKNGTIADFKNATDKAKAYAIKINITNGSIAQ